MIKRQLKVAFCVALLHKLGKPKHGLADDHWAGRLYPEMDQRCSLRYGRYAHLTVARRKAETRARQEEIVCVTYKTRKAKTTNLILRKKKKKKKKKSTDKTFCPPHPLNWLSMESIYSSKRFSFFLPVFIAFFLFLFCFFSLSLSFCLFFLRDLKILLALNSDFISFSCFILLIIFFLVIFFLFSFFMRYFPGLDEEVQKESLQHTSPLAEDAPWAHNSGRAPLRTARVGGVPSRGWELRRERDWTREPWRKRA